SSSGPAAAPAAASSVNSVPASAATARSAASPSGADPDAANIAVQYQGSAPVARVGSAVSSGVPPSKGSIRSARVGDGQNSASVVMAPGRPPSSRQDRRCVAADSLSGSGEI